MKNVILVRAVPSLGAKVLAEEMEVRRTTPDRVAALARRRPRLRFINWGNPRFPDDARAWWIGRMLNQQNNVALAGNKLWTLERLKHQNVPCLNFSTDATALDRRGILVARRTLTGSEGAGIVIIRPGDAVVPAPLYTQYEKKDAEFRVHVVRYPPSAQPDGSEEFWSLTHEKRKNRADPPTEKDEFLVRSYHNGWVFCRPTRLTEEQNTELVVLARNAVRALGLDFGAVDIIRSRQRGFLVCEVNTKPGMTDRGSTCKFYANAFKELLS